MKLRTCFVLLAAFAVAAPVFAHHGRGRGDYADVDYPAHWATEVEAQLASRRDALHAVWGAAAREGRGSAPVVTDLLRPVVGHVLHAVLRHRFPGATVLSPSHPSPPGP